MRKFQDALVEIDHQRTEDTLQIVERQAARAHAAIGSRKRSEATQAGIPGHESFGVIAIEGAGLRGRYDRGFRYGHTLAIERQANGSLYGVGEVKLACVPRHGAANGPRRHAHRDIDRRIVVGSTQHHLDLGIDGGASVRRVRVGCLNRLAHRRNLGFVGVAVDHEAKVERVAESGVENAVGPLRVELAEQCQVSWLLGELPDLGACSGVRR